MPTYNYGCEKCLKTFEIFHSMNDLLKDCPECLSVDSLEKIPSSINLVKKDEGKEKLGRKISETISEFKEDISFDKEKFKNRTFESLK